MERLLFFSHDGMKGEKERRKGISLPEGNKVSYQLLQGNLQVFSLYSFPPELSHLLK